MGITMRRFTFFMMLQIAGVVGVQAADRERGQLLYENHCTDCHESLVHIRDNRKAGSLSALRAQIERWHETLELPWQSDDVGDVLAYLNRRFYGYPTEGSQNQ